MYGNDVLTQITYTHRTMHTHYTDISQQNYVLIRYNLYIVLISFVGFGHLCPWKSCANKN